MKWIPSAQQGNLQSEGHLNAVTAIPQRMITLNQQGLLFSYLKRLWWVAWGNIYMQFIYIHIFFWFFEYFVLELSSWTERLRGALKEGVLNLWIHVCWNHIQASKICSELATPYLSALMNTFQPFLPGEMHIYSSVWIKFTIPYRLPKDNFSWTWMISRVYS